MTNENIHALESSLKSKITALSGVTAMILANIIVGVCEANSRIIAVLDKNTSGIFTTVLQGIVHALEDAGEGVQMEEFDADLTDIFITALIDQLNVSLGAISAEELETLTIIQLIEKERYINASLLSESFKGLESEEVDAYLEKYGESLEMISKIFNTNDLSLVIHNASNTKLGWHEEYVVHPLLHAMRDIHVEMQRIAAA